MPICPHCHTERHAQGLHMHVRACQHHPGEEQLRQWYVDERLSANAIGRKLGVSHDAVRRWLREAEVTMRRPPPPPKHKWESVAEADRKGVLDARGGCDQCEPAQRAACQESVRVGGPIACEGPLVQGKIVEVEYWQAAGWWPAGVRT